MSAPLIAPEGKDRLPKELQQYKAELFQITLGKDVATDLFEMLRKPNKMDDHSSMDLRIVRRSLAKFLGRDEYEVRA